ncbi:hypothetical protein D2C80_03325 [Helicobacter pylori]|nr:hypothetical protein D2C80_03325 [Helicobacter pylori]
MRRSLQLKDLRVTKPTHQASSLYFKSQYLNAMTIITKKNALHPHSQKLGTYGVFLQKSKKLAHPKR